MRTLFSWICFFIGVAIAIVAIPCMGLGLALLLLAFLIGGGSLKQLINEEQRRDLHKVWSTLATGYPNNVVDHSYLVALCYASKDEVRLAIKEACKQ